MKLPKQSLRKFLEKNKGYKVIKRCRDTLIVRLPNGEILKILDDVLLEVINATGFSLEERLDVVPSIDKKINFALPSRKLAVSGVVNSYTMSYVPGVDFTDYYEDIYNLKAYANIHSQIENNLQEGNAQGLVFPDLCTTENIRVTPEGKVVFIDYDGLQVKNMPAVGYSDFLGEEDETLTPKYYNPETMLFTPQVDVKSAIYLYFVDVFGVNLSAVNKINPNTGQVFTLNDLFALINLQDADIQEKVWRLFQESVPNEFLGDDIYRLAENYTLIKPFANSNLKRLKKR